MSCKSTTCPTLDDPAMHTTLQRERPLFRNNKSSGISLRFMLVSLVFLLGSVATYADTWYNNSHVTLTYGNDGRNYVDIRYLRYDADGCDDGLNWIKFWYVNPNNNQNVWIDEFSRDGGPKNPTTNLKKQGDAFSGDLSYTIVRWYYPANLFNGHIILLWQYRWTVDLNCWGISSKPREGYFYSYTKCNATLPYSNEITCTYNASAQSVSFSFQLYELYGENVSYSGVNAPVARHDLDDIFLEYHYDGKWNTILHGDCDNSMTDKDLQIFSQTNEGNITVTKFAKSSSRQFATVTWANIPERLRGQNIKFRVRADWDMYRTAVNAGINNTKEFTHYIQPNQRFSPTASYVYDKCSQKITLNWTHPNIAHIESFNIDKAFPRYSDDPWGELGVTYEAINNGISTSFVDDDIEHGRTYWYNITARYKDGKYSLDREDAIPVEADFSPLLPDHFKIETVMTPGGRPAAKVSWQHVCPQPKTVILYRKNVITGFVDQLSLDEKLEVFVDSLIQTCVKYSYQLKLTNQYNSRTSNWVDVVVDEGIFDAISNLRGSKGYSSDRVNIEWECSKPNLIRYYLIYRKRYGSNQDSTVVRVTENGRTTIWIDDTTDPGVYYQYFVVGKGECNGIETTSNILTTIGFRRPVGTISGQIAYEGGTPVENVRVALDLAEQGKKMSRSLQLSGSDSIVIPHNLRLGQPTGMAIEMWAYLQNQGGTSVFFSKSDSVNTYALSYSHADSMLIVHAGKDIFSFKTPQKIIDTYTHFSYNIGGSIFKLLMNGEVVYSATATFNTAKGDLVFGSNFKGYLDDLRMWSALRSNDAIRNDFTRMLTGEETRLTGYWRLDEGLGEFVFDMSKNLDKYNESHGYLVGARWSEFTPSPEQLSLCGITDASGNYLINGIHYAGTGQNFKITPMYGQHTFNPSNRSVFIGSTSNIHNSQDFKDISSFAVTGNVKYKGTNFPVEGVYIKVDGQIVMGSNQLPVTTNRQGNFTVRVPIGKHFISVEKHGHVFAESHFPPMNTDGEPSYFDFQQSISGLQFYDTTTVTLAGRIVGGTREGDKKIGFGQSTANIGQATIRLTTQKELDLDTLQNESSKFISFTTDPQTGEYEIKLIPEHFVVSSVGNENYSFDVSAYGNLIDLSGAFMISEETDTLYRNEVINGQVQRVFDRVNTYEYNQQKNWIYRSDPEMAVTAVDGTPVFSDRFLMYEETKIDIVDADHNHLFGFPVFTFDKHYTMKVAVFEKYVNYDNGANIEDKVPVTDGVLRINTDIAIDHTNRELSFNEDGIALYRFRGGFPNISEDENPEHSYTKAMSMVLQTGANKFAYWPSVEAPYRAYVLGGRPTGNNFVTTGPTKVDFILRDPPGSNSYAYIEEGFTVTESTSYNWGSSNSSSLKINHDFGIKVETVTGMPGCMISTEIVEKNTVGVTIEREESWNQTNEHTSTTTISTRFQTSADPSYVGSMADIFIGHSTNIVFGLNSMFVPMKTSEIQPGMSSIGTTINGEYTIGQRKGLRTSPEFNTMFVYTQNHIEHYLIPNLKNIRNLLFQNRPEIYEAVFTNIEDIKFGTNNDDQLWGSLRTRPSNNDPSVLFTGPSYICHAHRDPNFEIDSVRYYNIQISQWEEILRQNEREKLRAKADANHKNISFDAGSTIESSISITEEEMTTYSYEYTISGGKGLELGSAINQFGISVSIDASYSKTNSNSNTSGSSTTRTVGFVLADGNQGDYYSVDVKRCQNANGPVFMTRGGQSSCPYEGEELTRYYRPGREVLNNATMKVEAPTLAVNQAIVSGVPENRPALYTLRLGNDTEVGASAWYILTIDPTSNPHGAKLRLDGATIVNGVAVFVPANVTLSKTLELFKGRADVNDYEDIRLILHSQCQFDPTDDVADIADTVSISAYFVPACSEVTIASPTNQWLVNYAARDTLAIQLTNFDTQLSTFHKIDLQYKPQAASQWITLHSYFKDALLMANSQDQSKSLIGQATTLTYNWSMGSLPDRTYQIRARSICLDGSEFTTTPLTGIKDGKRPQVFGTPQPADGILSAGEDISIRFDEPIEEGLLTSYNFSIKGVLNNSVVAHGTSIQFDGISSKVETGYGLQLTNRSYTIEFWLKNDPYSVGTLLSYLTENGEGLELSTSLGTLTIRINDIETEGIDIVTNNSWDHYAFVYDHTDKSFACYQNDKQLIRFAAEALKNEARLTLGAHGLKPSFRGNMHDLRVWNKALLKSDIVSRMGVTLSGFEIGLSGYWPMDEGFGTMLTDKASHRNATTNALWLVEPAGYAYQFNGIDQALVANTGTIPVDTEMDMTMEFWFKAGDDARNTVALSNGNPSADTLALQRIVVVGFNQTGALTVQSNNKTLTTPTSYTDNQWHHFALVVQRRGNATVYIDGNKQTEMKGQEFGGLINSNLCIGALSNAEGSERSHYYKGMLDEIRIWNTARSQQLLSSYRNTRLAGTDAGLIANFPFETYESLMGVMNTSTTLSDLSIDPYSATNSSHCGILTNYGAMNFTTEAPAIKRSNPMTPVNFNFTVNNDQIILTPTDPPAMLEKSTLEISVMGVEDRNGNRLASPVTWTAYVDRNTVKWNEEQVRIEKEANTSHTFTATFKNSGGTAESFSIDNLPAWMTAQPRSGIVGPDKTQEIRFTITPGINVGTYSEDVYLHTNFGFDEKLSIHLRVKGDEPEWTVNPALYGSSMSFIARLKINGLTSTDIYDKIGVFAGDECRGVANVTYFDAIDDYLVMLVVYGDKSNETLTYKIYDASTGQVYVDVTPQPTFSPESILGDFVSPVIFECSNTIRKEIGLNKGWSWLSFNTDLSRYSSFGELVASIEATEGDRFIHGAQTRQYEGSQIGWQGTLGIPENGKLYTVFVAKGGQLEITGQALDPEKFTLPVGQGWNRIGYLPSINIEVNEALSAYPATAGDVIKGQLGFAMYNGSRWLGSLNWLEPDRGYMLKRNAISNASFRYPKGSSYARVAGSKAPRVQAMPSIDPYRYEHSLSVVAQLNQPITAEDTRIYTFIDNELRGVSRVDDEYLFITIFGQASDNGKPIRFELVSSEGVIELNSEFRFEGEATSTTNGGAASSGNTSSSSTNPASNTSSSATNSASNNLTFEGDALRGNFENPVVLAPAITTDLENLNSFKGVNIYPNPTPAIANIEIQLPASAIVRVEVYDTRGQLVQQTEAESYHAGLQRLRLQLGSLPGGVYTVRTYIDHQVNTQKVSKF